LKGFVVFGALLIVAACSTRRNTFVSRNMHALSTEYNILYNGGLALDKGVEELKLGYKDNFWEVLPIERMQVTEAELNPGQTRNANFQRAEDKAIKAIQKHSMNIDGSEKNPQMDEAHLMLGKARYYDQRFIPALEAFNYVLYKYPKSDKIYEVKIWREKTNMRLENDAIAANNLEKLLGEIKFKDQIFADANATLAQAYLNLEKRDSAIAKLKIATEFTKENEEKARYRFILGQLYEADGEKDKAYAMFQEVIDMKRKSPRQYVIQAHARQSLQFDYATGDTLAFLKKYEKLLKDRENRPYLGSLNHQLALFYDKNKQTSQAIKYYNASLKTATDDQYLRASNYRNLADIHFNKAKYPLAGKYYDSTLTQLNSKTREYKQIKKKRENLNDVIKYEGIAQANDSILNVVAMTQEQRVAYYSDYIEKLKKEDDARKKKEAEEALAMIEQQSKDLGGISEDDRALIEESRKNIKAGLSPANAPVKTKTTQKGAAGGDFYFYNASTVAYGKQEFRKNWGERAFRENWRTSASKRSTAVDPDNPDEQIASNDEPEVSDKPKAATEDERYAVDYYLKRVPTSKPVIDSLAKERNFAYYQLGLIYKEKFREYKRAADKLEKLLALNPEERLVLPSMYHLYKIYELTGDEKALAMKSRIISEYPDSRYAQILANMGSESVASLSPETAYSELFKRFEAGDYKYALAATEEAIDQYTGDEIVSKFELLKAHTIGKLRGLDEYKKALNFVALNYPNSSEGKDAEALLGKNVPALQNLKFSTSETSNWKILYRAKEPDEKNTKALVDKIKRFVKDRELNKISWSFDIYTETENFVVVHGMYSEEYAKGIASILKEFKEYKVTDTPIVISGQNYEIVQMKKNIDEYLNNPEFVPVSVTDQLPFTAKAKEQKEQAKPKKSVSELSNQQAESNKKAADQQAQQAKQQAPAAKTQPAQTQPGKTQQPTFQNNNQMPPNFGPPGAPGSMPTPGQPTQTGQPPRR
jgi:tetratricopeptide (TPR) repeat protein